MELPLVSQRQVLSVAALNRSARQLLESGLGTVWVEGEVSNFSRPSSGHWYFSLKDREAQLRCAMFRGRNALVGFTPREGQLVQARGRVSVYEPRGDYQLQVELLEDAGTGALQRAFEQLKSRLAAEGLFAAERKRALPVLPAAVGVITSPSGAALRDILRTLQMRFPAATVVIYPVPVQGASAAPAIVAALDLANRRDECQVLIVARGGGSLEDLWAFNDEGVARAIARSRIPVVSGVGHEVDFTIADFVADERAPTPTAAAQRVVPERHEWLRRVAVLAARLRSAVRRQLVLDGRRLQSLLARLQRAHPGARLAQHAQRIDELEQRLRRAQFQQLERLQARLQALGRALNAVSPLATLNRGFAVLTRAADDALLTDAAQLAVGEEIAARLARGSLRARVLSRSTGQ